MGCYNGYNGEGYRPFPKYVDYRPQLDWYNLDKTVKQCKDFVKSKGYMVSPGLM